jgi:hypothetical protein
VVTKVHTILEPYTIAPFSGVAEKDEQARHLDVQPPATGARRYEVSRTRWPRRIRLHAAAGGLQGPRLLLQSLLEVGAWAQPSR